MRRACLLSDSTLVSLLAVPFFSSPSTSSCSCLSPSSTTTTSHYLLKRLWLTHSSPFPSRNSQFLSLTRARSVRSTVDFSRAAMSNGKSVLKFVAKLQSAAKQRGNNVFTQEELFAFAAAMQHELKVASVNELIEVSLQRSSRAL